MSDEGNEADLVWGAGAIAKIIRRTPRATFHLLDSGALPAKKIGGRWVASRTKLINHLTDEERAA